MSNVIICKVHGHGLAMQAGGGTCVCPTGECLYPPQANAAVPSSQGPSIKRVILKIDGKRTTLSAFLHFNTIPNHSHLTLDELIKIVMLKQYMSVQIDNANGGKPLVIKRIGDKVN